MRDSVDVAETGEVEGLVQMGEGNETSLTVF